MTQRGRGRGQKNGGEGEREEVHGTVLSVTDITRMSQMRALCGSAKGGRRTGRGGDRVTRPSRERSYPSIRQTRLGNIVIIQGPGAAAP